MRLALPKLPTTRETGSLRGGAFAWSAQKGRPERTRASRARGPGLRPLGELKRANEEEEPRRAARHPRARAVASGSAYQSAGNVGTWDGPASQAAAKAEPGPRRRNARGSPPSRRPVKSKQGLDSRRALTGSRDLAAAEPRPAGPGQAGPNQADGGVAAAEAAGGRGSGPRSFLRQSRPPQLRKCSAPRVTSGRGRPAVALEAPRLLMTA